MFDIALELNARSKDVLRVGKSIGLRVADHLSTISDMQAIEVRTLYRVETGQIDTTLPPLPPPPPPKPAESAAKAAGEKSKDGASAAGDRKSRGAKDSQRTTSFKDRLKKKKTLQQQREQATEKVTGFRRRVPKVVRTQERGQAKRSFAAAPVADPNRQYELELPTTVKEFSQVIGVKVSDIIQHLFKQGRMARINDLLGKEECEILALDFEKTVVIREAKSLEETLAAEIAFVDEAQDVLVRSPVVTVMGHVDHGKTSLLDALRKTHVAAGEAGGITQSITAWKVTDPGSGQDVVFIDTPGHAAFSAMRARGAATTDVIILVVAADDGVMPETKESISHARAAGVPIVVALNKMDLPQANKDRALSQLAQAGLTPSEWGGTVEVIPCSALTGAGLEDLIQTVLTEAELLELKANAKRPAQGVVLEAHKDTERGITATLLVQNGTLHKGDTVLLGHTVAKVRSMASDRGDPLEQAGPATPVEILGLPAVPEAGDQFFVFTDLEKAQAHAKARADRKRLANLAKRHAKLADLFAQDRKVLRLVLKADMQGSIDALEKAIGALAISEIDIKFVHTGVGGINESDVTLAEASDAVIFGFRVIPEDRARSSAHERGVEIRTYQVIYHLTDDIRGALEGMLGHKEVETVLGQADVLQVFKASKIGSIAGCRIVDGVARRDARVRVVRDGIVIENDRGVESLRRHSDDVREVPKNFECGVRVVHYDDIKQGDRLQFYKIDKIKRTFDDVT